MTPAASREGWFQERQSEWLYRCLAAIEADPRKRQLFEALAQAADRQAGTWKKSLGTSTGEEAAFRPSVRARIVAALLDTFGPRRVRPMLVALKMRGLSVYDSPVAPGPVMPTRVEDVGDRHRGLHGGNLRAAVFGANDGLVSNASLILGVAGAGVASGTVLTTGIAGLLAGALSMAAGEYISVRSQREMFEYQIGLEREELGLNPDDLGSPWGAAIFSFASFAVGAIVPLLPYAAGAGGMRAVWLAALLAGLGLVAVGMTLSLFTGRQAWRGGLRMLLIGGGAGLIAYLIGRMLGVATG